MKEIRSFKEIQPLKDAEDFSDLKGAKLIDAYVRTLPSSPGVYRMLGRPTTDRDGRRVLYVGKAKNLKKRITAYASGRVHANRLHRLVAETQAMVFILTKTESEALLLEANLIRKFRPPYNILFQDDRSFPYIRFHNSLGAAAIGKYRGAKKKGDHMFGPFASAAACDDVIAILQTAFGLRICKDHVFLNRTRPCILHYMHKCAAPCTGVVNKEAYAQRVHAAMEFLHGRSKQVSEILAKNMRAAAEKEAYEKAAMYRDRLSALSKIKRGSTVFVDDKRDTDVIAMHRRADQCCVQVFFYRHGQNWGNRPYFPRFDPEESDARILHAFLVQFYSRRAPPSHILIDRDPAEMDVLKAMLARFGPVHLLIPQRGAKKKLVLLAGENAREELMRAMLGMKRAATQLRALGDLLGMEKPPRRIEVYDNAHSSGSHAVGGYVVFCARSGFDKRAYRRYHFSSSIDSRDDLALLRNVMMRRAAAVIENAQAGTGHTPANMEHSPAELKKHTPANMEQRPAKADHAAAQELHETSSHPDILLIDGGMTHLSQARAAFTEAGADPDALGIRFASIAKPYRIDAPAGTPFSVRSRRTSVRARHIGSESLYRWPQGKIDLPDHDPLVHFLQRLRDEAHRHVNMALRRRQGRALRKNPLAGIEAVGAKRQRALLYHFGSAKAVSEASPEEIAMVEGISTALAERIHAYFHAG